MKILVIHNHYLEKGGEDEVVDAEVNLLKNFGQEVVIFKHSNNEIKSFPFLKKLHLLHRGIIWSENSYKEVKDLVRREKPDIAHIHNIFIILSPSIYYALNEEKIPIVQTLHNYRLICPNGVFYRKGKICQDCRITDFTPAIIHRCWKNNLVLTLFLTRALNAHFKKKTFQEKINSYIALSEFSKSIFVKAGLSKDKIFIKPNFTDSEREKGTIPENFALFIGRLADYKGINTLVLAYQLLKHQRLKIIGDGPLFEILKKKIKKIPNIELLGSLPHGKVLQQLKLASFLIFPSECYETFGRVIIEAFSCAVPVIASKIGPAAELIKDNFTGLLFAPKNIGELVNKVTFLADNKDLLARMGENAYQEYLEKYAPEKNYDILMHIYRRTIENYVGTCQKQKNI